MTSFVRQMSQITTTEQSHQRTIEARHRHLRVPQGKFPVLRTYSDYDLGQLGQCYE